MLTWLLNGISSLPALLIYLVVFGLIFAEAALLVGFVFPGELAVIIGGVLANRSHQGHGSINLGVMMAVVVVAAITGDSTGYAVGHRYGERLLSIKLLQSRRAQLDRAIEFLRERGGWAVFLGRFTAFLRAVMPGLAGISKMPYRTFLVANAAGGLVWGAGFCYLGYLVGNAYQQLEHDATWAGYGLLAVLVLGGIGWHLRSKRKERALEAVAATAEHRSAKPTDAPHSL